MGGLCPHMGWTGSVQGCISRPSSPNGLLLVVCKHHVSQDLKDAVSEVCVLQGPRVPAGNSFWSPVVGLATPLTGCPLPQTRYLPSNAWLRFCLWDPQARQMFKHLFSTVDAFSFSFSPALGYLWVALKKQVRMMVYVPCLLGISTHAHLGNQALLCLTETAGNQVPSQLPSELTLPVQTQEPC